MAKNVTAGKSVASKATKTVSSRKAAKPGKGVAIATAKSAPSKATVVKAPAAKAPAAKAPAAKAPASKSTIAKKK